MRVAAVALAALLVASCAEKRSDATIEDARAACEAYFKTGSGSQPGEVERLAKPLRHSDYNDLGEALLRFETRSQLLQRKARDGDVTGAAKEAEALPKIAEKVLAECRKVGVGRTQ